MKTSPKYANHPLLPLMQLLDGIVTASEFSERQIEILEAIRLASPILKDRTPECYRLAKSPFLMRIGSATTPYRMARFVESRVKETLSLINKPTKSSVESIAPKQRSAKSSHHTTQPITMTYRQLRNSLPAICSIPTLGGRSEIEIHNPVGGFLMAINSKNGSYVVTEADWNHACTLRSHHMQNPWASKQYTSLSSYTSYGLIYAAALLRHSEQKFAEYTPKSSDCAA